jgi:glutathione S-transferase
MTDEAAAKRVLWGVGTPRTMRAHWALHELDLRYEVRPVQTRSAETQTAEFAALNSRRKIPVLEDDKFVITESAAIVAYLSDHYANGESALVPSGPAEYARWLEWCFFIMTELDATSWYVIRRHVGLKNIYGEAPAAVEAARAYFSRQLSCIVEALSEGRTYLTGDRFNTADILLTTCLIAAAKSQISVPDVCAEYVKRTTSRPAYTAAYKANYPPTCSPV